MDTLVKQGGVRDLFTLKQHSTWLVWKFVPNKNPEKKPIKKPYYVGGKVRAGRQGTPEDRAQLTTYEAAKFYAISHGYSGVGIAMSRELGISALDFDNCIEFGTIDPRVVKIIGSTYAEISPSGKGVRAIVLGDLGDYKSITNGTEFGFEVFTDKGFITFTDDVIDFTADPNHVEAPTTECLSICKERFSKKVEVLPRDVPHTVHVRTVTDEQIKSLLSYITETLNYDQWLSIGMAIHHETDGEGFELWDEWSALKADTYYGTEVLANKWHSFGRNVGVNPTTIGTLVHYAHLAGADSSILGEKATDDDYEIMEDDPEEKKSYFNIQSALEFKNTQLNTEWLVDGVFPRGKLGMIYGPSTSGKSFFTIDLCAALARGVPWRDKDTVKSRVLYVVAEGRSGFRKRLDAYDTHHQLESIPDFDIISDVKPQLMDKRNVALLIKEIEVRGQYDLVVLDTFAQVTTGADENTAKDINIVLNSCSLISDAVGAMCLLVHHTGKDETKGARGGSGLFAACDIVMSITANGDSRCAEITKNKDGEAGEQFSFCLGSVYDAEGELHPSVVVQHVDSFARATPLKGKKLARWVALQEELKMMSFLQIDEARDICRKAIPSTGHAGNDARDARRAVEGFEKDGLICVENDNVSFPNATIIS